MNPRDARMPMPSDRFKKELGAMTMVLVYSFGIAAFANNDFDVGMQYINDKNYEKALPCLDRSVDAEPTNGNFHFWRGKVLSELDKSKEACAEFKIASILASDTKLKDECRGELAKYNIEAPKGSVDESFQDPQSPNAAREPKAARNTNNKKDSKQDSAAKSNNENDDGSSKGEKLFKLSSKKLEWNLQMDNRFLQSMKAQNDGLEALSRGSNWRIQSNSGLRNNFSTADLKASLRGPAHTTLPLSAGERKALGASDVVLILDHSGSMMQPDCPSAGSAVEPRISWCAEELEKFADDLGSAFPHGFTFIPFDSKPDVIQIRSAAELRNALHSLTSGGGTDLSAALTEAFRVHSKHPNQPLLIAVVSDAEIDVHSCELTLVNATRQFPLPNGVFVTLAQIGIVAEQETADRINYLANLKARSGAAYDAFFGVPFSKLRQDGLGRDLLIGLRSNYYASTARASKPGSAVESAAEARSGRDSRWAVQRSCSPDASAPGGKPAASLSRKEPIVSAVSSKKNDSDRNSKSAAQNKP